MKALVLGGARCLWRDAKAALDLFEPDIVVACNDAGVDWPGHLDVWVTLHCEKFGWWQAKRRERGGNDDYVAITHLNADRALPGRVDAYLSHVWQGMTASGSSGLFATTAALDLGATHAVLAGIPMDARQAHYFDGREWHDRASFVKAWEIVHARLADRVRSMSGWTRMRLGAPTREWLGVA